MARLFEVLVDPIIHFIATLGYPGIFACLALESACIPVPSEIVLIFSGYLIFQGKFNFFWALLSAIGGALLGSTVSYLVGYRFGKPFLVRLGKYILLSEKRLERAEGWFNKHGAKAAIYCRLILGIRVIISPLVGIAKVKYSHFIIYTFLGYLIWSVLGLLLGDLVGLLRRDLKPFIMEFHRWGIAILLILSLCALIFIFWLRKRKK